MTERDGDRPPEPPPSDASWDGATLSEALGVSLEACVDLTHGPGLRFRLGKQSLTVELFPATRVARFSTADLQLALFRQEPPSLAPEGLVFALPGHPANRFLSLSPAGELLLMVSPDVTSASEDSATPPRGASPGIGETTPTISQDTQSPVRGHQTSQDASISASDPTTTDPDTETSARPRPTTPHDASQTLPPEPREGQPRVAFTGRLARDPRTKETRSGTPVMEFAVGVPVEGQEKPEWRDVAIFGDRARKLEGALKRGDAVEVVAYVHERARTAKDGTTRIEREYYATAVAPRGKGKRRGGDDPEG